MSAVLQWKRSATEQVGPDWMTFANVASVASGHGYVLLYRSGDMRAACFTDGVRGGGL